MVSHIFALQTGDSGHFLAFAAMLAEEVTSCLPGAKLAAVTREASTGTIYGVPWLKPVWRVGRLEVPEKFPASQICWRCPWGFVDVLGALSVCTC